MEKGKLKTLINSITYKPRSDSRLTVLAEFKDTEFSNRMVFCACSCGNFVYTRKLKVDRCTTRSCGCLNHQKFINLGNMRRLDGPNAAINSVITAYKKGAIRRGLSYNLPRDLFISLTNSDCNYCGKPPSTVRKRIKDTSAHFIYNGLDRVDNNIGYEVDNVVPCCYTCNKVKMAQDLDHMYQHLIKILGNVDGLQTE